jgi:hypothetical protein
MTPLEFDQPTHAWVVEYRDLEAPNETEAITIYEYADKPMSEADVLEEVRYSFSVFSESNDATLEEVGIEIVSIVREEC